MRTIGIIGGMGPMATADFFEKIVAATPARLDQDHPHIIIDNNPKIPSRVDALLKHTPSPLPELLRSARFLTDAGAEILAMPCNTAHYWHAPIQETVHIPFPHIIEVTARHIKNCNAGNPPRFLLGASTATIETGLYQHIFSAHGLPLTIPTPSEQQIIASVIEKTKAGCLETNPHLPALQSILEDYQNRGVHGFIGGCTEIPLLFPYLTISIKKIDPTLLLAQEIVRLSFSS